MLQVARAYAFADRAFVAVVVVLHTYVLFVSRMILVFHVCVFHLACFRAICISSGTCVQYIYTHIY